MRYTLLLAFCLCSIGQVGATDELAERKQITAAARQAFVTGNLDNLETMSESFRTERSRTSSGIWKLTLFYDGITWILSTPSNEIEGSFEAMEDYTAKWATNYPDSPAAHIARGIAFVKQAWGFRGAGYASTVKPEDWAPFRQYLAKAREYLEANKEVAARDPRWYETMLMIARAEGWDRQQFDGLLNEAVEREPDFYQHYFMALEYFLPKWGGDIRQIENFAREAATRTTKEGGQALYARIYWFASAVEFHDDLFTRSLADWPRMREGFEDVLSKYPDSWNLNNYARFACMAKDKPKTRELLARIESRIVPEAWEPEPSLKQCVNWSLQLAPETLSLRSGIGQPASGRPLS